VLITGIVKIFVAGRVLCKGLRLKKQSPGSCLVQAGLSHLSNQAAPSGTLITLAPGAVSCAVVQSLPEHHCLLTRLHQPDLTAHAQPQPAERGHDDKNTFRFVPCEMSLSSFSRLYMTALSLTF